MENNKSHVNDCPVCGSHNISVWVSYSPNNSKKPNPYYFVECQDCLFVTKTYSTETEAVKIWNKISNCLSKGDDKNV